MIYNGQPDNQGVEKDRWKFTRRFFIYDTVSGITESGVYNEKMAPNVVRFAKSIKLKIDLDPNDNERIFPPYLDITYKYLEKEQVAGKSVLEEVQFIAEYNDTNDFEEMRTVTFIVLMSIMGILIIGYFAKIRQDIKQATGTQNPELSDLLNKSLGFGLKAYSTIFFWYLVFQTGIWFIFFKLQERVFCFLPTLDRQDIYEYYDEMLISLIVIKVVAVFLKIYSQSEMKTFLVDWEPTKYYHKYHETDPSMDGQRNQAKLSVSPWRRLFIANELNELQSQKHINSETVLLLFLLITEGVGARFLSQMEPHLSNSSSETQQNYALNFFVITVVIFGIGVVDYVLQMIVAVKYPPAYVEF